MTRFKVSNFNDFLSMKVRDCLVMESDVNHLELYKIADAKGLIAEITPFIVDPNFTSVLLQHPDETSLIHLTRQLITLAASSPDRSASACVQVSNPMSFKTAAYKQARLLGLLGGMKVNVLDEIVSITLKDSNFNLSKLVAQVLTKLPAELPIDMAKNKTVLVTVIHQEAFKQRIKVTTRTVGDKIVIKPNHNYRERVSNSVLREQIRMLSWDMPTPLTSADRSALLSTLAAQDRLQCYTVKAGVITKRAFIIKKYQGNTVLRVFGQIVYMGDDYDKMNEILKQYGKTVEDAL